MLNVTGVWGFVEPVLVGFADQLVAFGNANDRSTITGE